MKRMSGATGLAGPEISRRRLLAGAGVLVGTSIIGFPAIRTRAAATLKIGTYGGYFKDSFDQHIYPAFTEATGIEVESIAEPTGEAWLVQLQTAARANVAPADVSMMAQVARIKGQNAELWAPLDEAELANAGNLEPHFVQRYQDGRISAIGAVSWYITLVTNTEVYPEAPTSWKALWDPANADRLGLLALVSNSFLLEITAGTWFGGDGILDTEDGILEVLDKLAEVKPNVRLWYRDEGQFQQALQAGEIPMGQYYHDVTGLASPGPAGALDLPRGGRGARLGLLVRVQGLAGPGGGAHVHRLHVPSRGPGRTVTQGRHGTDREARPARPHRRGVRRGRERHPADHPALRSVRRARRLAESEVDGDDCRVTPARLAGGRRLSGPSPDGVSCARGGMPWRCALSA